MTAKAGTCDSLALGWRVTPSLDPEYWLNRSSQAPHDPEARDAALVYVPADQIARHTTVIAQSGSGKSYFLGRLVEEILLRTKARCLVFDPNADFRQFSKVRGPKLWQCPYYDVVRRNGHLPHENSRDEFLRDWNSIDVAVKVGTQLPEEEFEHLKLSWSALNIDFFADNLSPLLKSDVYYCHLFFRSFENLFSISQRDSDLKSVQPVEFVEEAERLFRRSTELTSEDDVRASLHHEFQLEAIDKRPVRQPQRQPALIKALFQFGEKEASRAAVRWIDTVVRAPRYVSKAAARFYFAKARAHFAEGVFHPEINLVELEETRNRCEIVDLPSLRDRDTRRLAVNARLTREWDRLQYEWEEAISFVDPADDRRVPTFIVVDEAHNLMPARPRTRADRALREQFRTIVAEGRKYGAFLLAVTQRPDKLDPLILSECENACLMRLSSGPVAKATYEMLGLDNLSRNLLQKCRNLDLKQANANTLSACRFGIGKGAGERGRRGWRRRSLLGCGWLHGEARVHSRAVGGAADRSVRTPASE